MCDGYCLNRHSYHDRGGRVHNLYALASREGLRDVVKQLLQKGDPNDVLAMSARSIAAIQEHGMKYAIGRKLARKISDNVFLVEFKSRRTAWRMAAYIHDRKDDKAIAVLLEDFRGHGGKSGKYLVKQYAHSKKKP